MYFPLTLLAILSEAFSLQDEDKRRWVIPQTSELNSNKLSCKGTIRKFMLLTEAIKGENSSDTDLVCSPITALLGLAKLGFGSYGGVLREIERAIGADYEQEVEKQAKKIIRTLNYMPGVTLSVGSRVYMPDTYTLDRYFKKKTNKVFGTSIHPIDFSQPDKAAKKINDWIGLITNYEIHDIVSENQLKNFENFLVVNAIYFKGKWKYSFPTILSERFNDGRRVVVVPMMKQEREYFFSYSESLEAQVVEIPFHGNKASMVIFLPNSVNGLQDMLNKMKEEPSTIGAAVNQMKKQRVRLSIPRFSVTTTWDLVHLFKKLDMKAVLKPGGLNDVTNATNSLFISLAIQKTRIEIDGEGTRGSETYDGTMDPKISLDHIEFNANHPFVFMVLGCGEQILGGVYAASNEKTYEETIKY